MNRATVALLTLVLGTAVLVVPTAAASAGPPVRSVTVSGAGVGMYPAFSVGIRRYAVTTTDDTAGTVQVTARTTDPRGRIWVDGLVGVRPTTTVTGLHNGDEIAVRIEDSGGATTYSLVYLPAGFPRLVVTSQRPGVARGVVGLTIYHGQRRRVPAWETAVDVNGVPRWVNERSRPTGDLKRQPDGQLTVSRRTLTPGRTGSAVVVLDGQFREVARYETANHPNTDGHDSMLLPNGDRILIGYEPNDATGRTDAVIQRLDSAGAVTFEWNSQSVAGESLDAGPDYAHINSVWPLPNGDILASFRHLSAVYRIATSPHDGFATGDIVWRLGGRRSDFTFVGDGGPFVSGPCAQHAASLFTDPNGNDHVLLFDNGSGSPFGIHCVDPADPAGTPVARPATRVVEYVLDYQRRTATNVWSYAPQGRFSGFAGSAQRLANGNTLIGWGSWRGALATEVSRTGRVVWEVAATGPDARVMSYRAAKFGLPDEIDPVLQVRSPGLGARYVQGARVVARLHCTDRGGSGLATCGGPLVSGDRVDTSRPGTHTITFAARDYAGNVTTVRRTYAVVENSDRPDAQAQRTTGAWAGDNVYAHWSRQTVPRGLAAAGERVRVLLRVQNDGARPGRYTLVGTAGDPRFHAVYRVGDRDITAQVEAGQYVTPRLAHGQSWTIALVVRRTRPAVPGDSRVFVLTARSRTTTERDAVGVRVSATRT